MVRTVPAWLPGQGSIKVSQNRCVSLLAICRRKKWKQQRWDYKVNQETTVFCLVCGSEGCDEGQCRVSVAMNPNCFSAVLPTVRKTTTMWMWRLHVSTFTILLLAFCFSCSTKRTDQGKYKALLQILVCSDRFVRESLLSCRVNFVELDSV